MTSILQRVQLLKKYPDLVNIEDIQENFFLVSQNSVSSLINISSIFGSLFLCHIDYLIQTIDIFTIGQIIQILEQTPNLYEQERSSLMKIKDKLSELVKYLQECEKWAFDNDNDEDQIKDHDQQLNKLIQLEQFFIDDRKFVDGFELAASIYIMKMITLKHNENRDQERIHTIIFISPNLQNPTQIYESQIDEIGKLFNLNYQIYLEFSQNQLIQITSSNQNKDGFQYPSDYHLILNQEQNSIRFGYNTTLARKQQTFQDNLYSQNELGQIIYDSIQELKPIQNSAKLTKLYINNIIQEQNETREKLEDGNKKLTDLIKQTQKQIHDYSQQITYMKQQQIDKECEIQSLKVLYEIQ